MQCFKQWLWVLWESWWCPHGATSTLSLCCGLIISVNISRVPILVFSQGPLCTSLKSVFGDVATPLLGLQRLIFQIHKQFIDWIGTNHYTCCSLHLLLCWLSEVLRPVGFLGGDKDLNKWRGHLYTCPHTHSTQATPQPNQSAVTVCC